MPLHPQYFRVFCDGRRPFSVFSGKGRDGAARARRGNADKMV